MIGSGRSSSDIKIQKALGDFPYTNAFIVAAKGETSSTSFQLATTVPDMKVLPYYLLLAAQKIYVSSTSADDDFVTGQGAKLVVIVGLGENYEMQEEVKELDGLNPVESTLNFTRVFEMTILQWGTNIDIATGDSIQSGTIYAGTGLVVAGIPLNKLVAINVADNDPNSRVGVYTVPSGSLAVVKSITLFTTPDNQLANAMYFTMGLHLFGTPSESKYKFSIFYFDGQFQYIPESVAIFPPRTDIELRIKNQNIKSKEVSIFFEVELRELR